MESLNTLNLSFNSATGVINNAGGVNDMIGSQGGLSYANQGRNRIDAANQDVGEGRSDLIRFRRIDRAAMDEIMPYLQRESGRSCDFSYGGVLMWVDYYNYEYAIVNGTLLIKGLVEDDRSMTAFSLPLGDMPLEESVKLLREYCEEAGIRLRFSAIPENALEEFISLNPLRVEELTDMGDYIYDAEKLGTLSGKKMSKKRNHVNKFEAENPDASVEWIDASNLKEVLDFMDLVDGEADSDRQAASERELTRRVLENGVVNGSEMSGLVLRAGGKIVAFSVGDVKGDTLFVHIEKALREVNGSYEAINKYFVREMMNKYEGIKYVNREDDAGDIGLRMAKESYHPVEILKKYNVFF